MTNRNLASGKIVSSRKVAAGLSVYTSCDVSCGKMAYKVKRNLCLNVFISLIVAMSLVFLSGCGSPVLLQQDVNQAAGGTTHTVQDCENRSVELPLKLEHIACCDSFAGELCVMSGAGPQIIGCPSGVRSDKLLQEIYPGLQDNTIHLSGGHLNAETLLEYNCDLAIVRPNLSESEYSKLDKLGIPYLIVGYSNMDEQMGAMRVVGQALGGKPQEKIDKLIDYYQDVISLVGDRTSQVDEKSRVQVYHSINDALLSDGYQSLGKDWIEKAGARDLSAQKDLGPSKDYIVSAEQIYSWNPQVIINNSAQATEEFKTFKNWEGLAAVENNQIYTVPTGLSRWGQRGSTETYLACLWLGTTLYPDLFADIDFKQEVIDYYKLFFDIDVDDTLYASMMSGVGLRQMGSQNNNSGPDKDATSSIGHQ